MSEQLVVVQRSQHIIVNQPSGRVDVVNSGAQGPPGATGPEGPEGPANPGTEYLDEIAALEAEVLGYREPVTSPSIISDTASAGLVRFHDRGYNGITNFLGFSNSTTPTSLFDAPRTIPANSFTGDGNNVFKFVAGGYVENSSGSARNMTLVLEMLGFTYSTGAVSFPVAAATPWRLSVEITIRQVFGNTALGMLTFQYGTAGAAILTPTIGGTYIGVPITADGTLDLKATLGHAATTFKVYTLYASGQFCRNG